MSEFQLYFSVNHYDSDGDIIDRGVFLHFGNTRVKVADRPEDFQRFKIVIQQMAQEIQEVYCD